MNSHTSQSIPPQLSAAELAAKGAANRASDRRDYYHTLTAMHQWLLKETMNSYVSQEELTLLTVIPMALHSHIPTHILWCINAHLPYLKDRGFVA